MFDSRSESSEMLLVVLSDVVGSFGDKERPFFALPSPWDDGDLKGRLELIWT